MKFKKRVTLLLLTLFLGFTTQVAAQGIEFDTSSWQELLAKAKSNNKLIFLDCFTDWCGPCKGMAERVFTDPMVGDYMNANFICTKIDMEKGEGIELHKKYKNYIPGFPTYLLIDHTGEVVHQAAGYMDPEKFINSMKQGVENKTWIAFKERFDAGERDWEFLSEYLILLEEAVQKEPTEEAKAYALSNLTIDALRESEGAYRIFREYWTEANTPLFKEFIATSSIYRKYEERERDIAEWANRLYDRILRSMESALIDEENSASTLRASQMPREIEEVLVELHKGYSLGREEQIAKLLIYKSLLAEDFDRFNTLLENGKEMGMFRYYSHTISDFCKKFFSDVKGKKNIARCLELTEIDPEAKGTAPRQIRAWAHFLERSGEKKRAAELFELADVKEEEIRKYYEQFFK